MARFFMCKNCKNTMLVLDTKENPYCGGTEMVELIANTEDASTEKHVPVYTLDGNKLTVKVGSVEHPMTPAHLIEWIYVEFEKGGQFVRFSSDDKPVAVFDNSINKAVAVYEFCNLHGLWKTEIK